VDRREITAERSITASLGIFPVYRPEWTRTASVPDTIIVSSFGSDHSLPSVLWFVEVDTGRSGRLFQPDGIHTHSAVWSPDDREIAVIAVDSTSPSERYRVSILRNARELLFGSSTTPDLATTPIVSTGDVLSIDHLDWSRPR
jgi:dipeptidyl aminopeptidase/acylaminoacyl peptidase